MIIYNSIYSFGTFFWNVNIWKKIAITKEYVQMYTFVIAICFLQVLQKRTFK